MQSIDDITTAAAGDYPALHRLFGAYFHQDWQDDYTTSTGAVQAFLREAPYAIVDAARRELDALLATPLDDAELGRLLREGFDCNYVPQVDELTTRAWLARIRDLMHPVRPA
ncbi:MAG: hypothetical protein JOZ75_13925 [Candidatus Dormibacteraeota bacterium]|nr:hypothetical protein [Candidatus Dormibacteraeota bacterium]